MTKSLLGMMVVGLVALASVLWRERPAATPLPIAKPAPTERPWLSREARDQIVATDGTLGPLFAGVTLGGPAPSREVRARIAAFSRANDVSIEFEVADDELLAVRFDVTFGGCCGYEGVDALGAYIGRPKHIGGCGSPTFYYDNWARTLEDSTHVRGTVNINRLSLRWEHSVSLDDVLTRAEHMLGTDRGTVSANARERWLELDPGKRYVLELPYSFTDPSAQPDRSLPADRGIELVTDRRIVTEVKLTTFNEPGAHLKARWGTPRIHGEQWTWHKGDRTIVASFENQSFDSPKTTITLSRR